MMTDQNWIGFGHDGPDGEIVANEMIHNQHVTVGIRVGDKPELSETFDTSATAGRDLLLDYAKHLVDTADPRVCRDR